MQRQKIYIWSILAIIGTLFSHPARADDTTLRWFNYINKTYDEDLGAFVDQKNKNCNITDADLPCKDIKKGGTGTCKIRYLSCNRAGLAKILVNVRKEKELLAKELEEYAPCKLFAIEARTVSQILAPYFKMFEKLQNDHAKLSFYETLTANWIDDVSQKVAQVTNEISQLTNAEAYSRIRQLLSELDVLKFNDQLKKAESDLWVSTEKYFYPLLRLYEKQTVINDKIDNLKALIKKDLIKKCFNGNDISTFQYTLQSTLGNRSFSDQITSLIESYYGIQDKINELDEKRDALVDSVNRLGKNVLAEVTYQLNVELAQGVVNDYYLSLNDPIVLAETEFAVRSGKQRLTKLLTEYRSPFSAILEAEAFLVLIKEMSKNIEKIPFTDSMRGVVKATLQGAQQECLNTIQVATSYSKERKDLMLKAREQKIIAWKRTHEQQNKNAPAECYDLAASSTENTILSERDFQRFLDECDNRL